MLDNDEPQYIEIRAVADAGLREAIGGVCIHWAILELTVERVIAHQAGERGVVSYEKPLGKNLERLCAITQASVTLTDTQKDEILGLVTDVQAIAIERHRVTHGLWGKDANGVIHSLFVAIKRNVAPVMPITVEDITNLKRRIILLGKSLRAFVDPSDSVQIKWEKD